MTSEARVRAAFASMAIECERLGSPFTGLLLGQAAERLDRSTAIGRRVLDWQGIPDARHDSVPLRLAGGLHALARAGRRPSLARLYPPAAPPDAKTLWREAAAAIAAEAEVLGAWLDHAPRTNEVARSPILMCGLMAIAAATGGMPIALHELGASGGLNLLSSPGSADSARTRKPLTSGVVGGSGQQPSQRKAGSAHARNRPRENHWPDAARSGAGGKPPRHRVFGRCRGDPVRGPGRAQRASRCARRATRARTTICTRAG